jgi:hypothetical protein
MHTEFQRTTAYSVSDCVVAALDNSVRVYNNILTQHSTNPLARVDTGMV